MNTGIEYPKDSVPRERWRVISDMQRQGRSSVDCFTRELQSDDKRIRIAAADALGNIGDQKALDLLVRLLSDTDHDVRFASAVALGKLGGPGAVRALEDACRDKNCYVRMAAEEALILLRDDHIS